MVRERSGEVNIPLDLKLEILTKLPAKSVVRFLCVSKLWKTIIRDYIVKDSIVLRSLTQPLRDPHFIFRRVHNSSSLSFDDSPTYSFAYYHHQTTHEEEQLVSLEETSRDSYGIPNFQYVRGLIGYDASPYSCHQFTIYNPTTRQTVSLPNTVHTSTQLDMHCSFFLGYDPLSNQYKIVCVCLARKQTCQVYTLGDILANQWRNIPCWIERHHPYLHKICINGVIYYKAMRAAVKVISFVLVSFDLGFERFNHIQTPKKLSICLGDAIFLDYKGKLGCICKDKDNLDMNLWVLENAERQEWSEITYIDVFRDLPSFNVAFAGITYQGDEIVFGGQSQRTELGATVYYYDMKIKKIRKVEIKTTMPSCDRISISNVVTDHVDNIMSLS